MSDIQERLSWLKSPFRFVTDERSKMMLLLAYLHANKHSPDPSTKNGAIIANWEGTVISKSANKFPDLVDATEERLADKPTKYRLVVHAENGAVFNAARRGSKTDGSILYCPFYACSECAKAIIQGGIRRVIGHAQLMALASDHTTWTESIVEAWATLNEAGVQCVLYDGDIGVTTRFNGKDIPV